MSNPIYWGTRTGVSKSKDWPPCFSQQNAWIYRSFWQLILGSELLWHRRSARTRAWHQLVSEILCFGGWISRKHSVKRYFNIISRSFLMYVQISSSRKFPPFRKIQKSLKQSVPTENPLGWRHTGCCLMVTVWWLHLQLVKLPNAKNPLKKFSLAWKQWDEFQTHENTLNTTQTSMSCPSFWKGVCLGKYVL